MARNSERKIRTISASQLKPGMTINRFGSAKTIAKVVPGVAKGYKFVTLSYVNSPERSTHYLTQLMEVANA